MIIDVIFSFFKYLLFLKFHKKNKTIINLVFTMTEPEGKK